MKNLLIAAFVLLVLLASGSLFAVKEGERAIVIQFGKVQRDDATGETRVLSQDYTLNFRLLTRYAI